MLLVPSHCRRANPQNVDGITNATAIEGQGDHLTANFGCSTPILVLQEKDPPFALPVLTLVALGPIGLLARLDDLCAVTVGTLYRNGNHRLPPRTLNVRGHHTGKLLI